MKRIVVFKFTDFNESIKERAMELAWEFPGVTEVVKVEGEGQLEVRGEFRPFELTNELRQIDEFVETIRIRADRVTEPEVKLQQQDEGELPINIEDVSKPSNDDASSSNGTGYGWWDQTKGIAVGAAVKAKDISVGAAVMAKDIGVGAAVKVKDIGAGAVGLIPSYEQQNNRNKNKEKESKAKPQPKQGGGGYQRGKRFGGEEPQQEKGGIIEDIYGFIEKRKFQQENRLRNEFLKEQDMNQKKEWLERLKKHGLLPKSEGGTTQGSAVTGNTGSWWDTIRTGGASGASEEASTTHPREP